MTSVIDVAAAAGPGSTGERARTAASRHDDELGIVDRYIRQQQTMTAVDRFAKSHDDDLLPAQARYYRDLIPLTTPQAGQQYAFEVDLDSCSGCKACVSACHSLNGLDDGESFRSTGTLIGTVPSSVSSPASTEPPLPLGAMIVEPWQQTVTAACHHCVDPACLNGCPVDAYEKDPITGIVKHLDDQCIGCSYCTLTCPYEVPQYNTGRGIVRKCDLCSDRLAVGEAPACVQACPTSAISVTIIEIAEAITACAAEGATLVPAAPSSSLTVPTTRYRSSKPIPAGALPADHFTQQPSHAHMPLTVMLVLTQLSVGAFVLGWLFDGFGSPALVTAVRPYTAGLAAGVGLMALGASTLHLGRPQYAWRAVIGLRHSWLSREIVAFSAFAGLAFVYAAMVFADAPGGLVRVVGSAVTVVGLAGVVCSVMIYAVTSRQWWQWWRLAAKFTATSVITGSTALIVAALIAAAADHDAVRGVLTDIVRPLSALVMLATVVTLGTEAMIFRHLRDDSFTDLRRTAMLMSDDLRATTVRRFAWGAFGGFVLPLTLFVMSMPGAKTSSPVPSLVLAIVALAAVVVGELSERWQFFTAVTSPRLPGVQP